MKNRREMTAEQHLKVLEDKGEIRVKGTVITVWADEDGEVPQVVSDYMAHFSRKGYKVVWH